MMDNAWSLWHRWLAAGDGGGGGGLEAPAHGKEGGRGGIGMGRGKEKQRQKSYRGTALEITVVLETAERGESGAVCSTVQLM